MQYKYEMHQHTAPCSKCGRADPELLVKALKKEGFAGVVMTDHFYHGNSGIDRGLEWKEFCKAYVDSYLKAKKIGDEIGIDVIFAIEEGLGEGKEVLLYGITPEFLYGHPELKDADLEKIYNLVNDFGGLVIQAHPFREQPYIKNPDEEIDERFLHGYEVWNQCNFPDRNDMAIAVAERTGKIKTVGSDAHVEEFENRTAIVSEKRIKNEKDLVNVLKSGKYRLFYNGEIR